MNKIKKRENRMYFLTQTEYIYLPLRVQSKTYIYSTTKKNKNQILSSKIFTKGWCNNGKN